MIGLQNIAETFRMEYKSVADSVGVSKQTFQDWLKGRRKIPEPRLQQLAKLFGITNLELFQKELTESEKLEIQKLYFQQTDKHHEVKVPFIDSNGMEYMTIHEVSQNKGIIDFLNEKGEVVQLIESVEMVVSHEVEEKTNNILMLKGLTSIMKSGSKSDKTIANLMLYYLTDYKNNEFGGIKPEFMGAVESGFFDKLDVLFRENKLVE